MKSLREEIEEAIGKTTYDSLPLKSILADAVMLAIEKRAAKLGSAEIAEHIAEYIADRLGVGSYDIKAREGISEVIQSAIAEALALADASPERVAERKALQMLRWRNTTPVVQPLSLSEKDILALASSPVAAKEGEAK